MHRDRLTLRRVRENVRNMTAQLVGRHWSEFGTAEPVLVNLIAKYQSVVGRMLIAKNPRFLFSSDDPKAKVVLSKLQEAVNRRIEEMGVVNTLQSGVVNSLYSLGITKVAIASPVDAAAQGWGVKSGQWYCENVDPDDYVCDTNAKELTRLGYEGHRVRVPLDAVKKMYGRKAADLVSSEHAQFNAEGDERIDVLFRGYYGSREEYRDMVDLWEIYLADENKVVVVADSTLTGGYYSRWEREAAPLWEQRWVGPPAGPFHKLAMMKVPGNLWPKAPIQDVFDLHLVINGMARKLVDQAEGQKDVYAVRGGKTEDGERIRSAMDREMVPCDSDPTVISHPGPNQGVFSLFQALDGTFNREAGNLDLLAGTGNLSPTAAQDKMLNANASRVIGDMQDRTTDWITSIGKAATWYELYHPHNVTRAEDPKYSKLIGEPFVRTTTPKERRAIPPDLYSVRVDPYSLRHKTPEERLAWISDRVRNQIIPILPLIQQKGYDFDFGGLFQLEAELGDEPRWAGLMSVGEPPEADPSGGGQGQDGAGHGTTLPPNTSREYVRRSENRGNPQQSSAASQNQSQMNGPMGGAR